MTEPQDPPVEPQDPPVKRRWWWRFPSTLGGVCYLAVLAAAAVAVLVVVLGDWRVGVRVLATALAVAGVCRLALPQDNAGMLAVRRRSIDVALLVGVGLLLWWLAGSIPDQPG